MHAERLPETIMYTDFGADRSSCFHFRARTNRQTERLDERPTHAGGYAGVGRPNLQLHATTATKKKDVTTKRLRAR